MGGIDGRDGRPSAAPSSIPPPDGCTDYDPSVIATCLDTVSAVAALPTGAGGVSVLAGERRSGKIFLVSPKGEKILIADLEVDASGGGGLTALAPSPTYREDRLIFAYITTETDNRVVRFARGQPAEPVLTGIPKGATHNSGALLVGARGALLVATGDAGKHELAKDPESLAGKVLRIDFTGAAAEGNPNPGSRVISRGLYDPGGMCVSKDGSRLWVTDHQPDRGVVHLVEAGDPLGSPAWTWPEKPGLAGCVEWSGMLTIATSRAGNLQNLPITDTGAVTGEPRTTLGQDSERHYGRLGGMDLVTPSLAVVGTVNRAGGDPVSSDDRVVLIPRSTAPKAGRS